MEIAQNTPPPLPTDPGPQDRKIFLEYRKAQSKIDRRMAKEFAHLFSCECKIPVEPIKGSCFCMTCLKYVRETDGS